jgi:hypothetical protein
VGWPASKLSSDGVVDLALDYEGPWAYHLNTQAVLVLVFFVYGKHVALGVEVDHHEPVEEAVEQHSHTEVGDDILDVAVGAVLVDNAVEDLADDVDVVEDTGIVVVEPVQAAALVDVEAAESHTSFAVVVGVEEVGEADVTGSQ